MLTKRNIDYFNLGKSENKKFWERLGGKPNFENKTVLDFGCGHGALSVEIAESGAKKVLGIDYIKVNLSNHPVAAIFNLLRRIKFLEEYFIYNIYCILKKVIG